MYIAEHRAVSSALDISLGNSISVWDSARTPIKFARVTRLVSGEPANYQAAKKKKKTSSNIPFGLETRRVIRFSICVLFSPVSYMCSYFFLFCFYQSLCETHVKPPNVRLSIWNSSVRPSIGLNSHAVEPHAIEKYRDYYGEKKPEKYLRYLAFFSNVTIYPCGKICCWVLFRLYRARNCFCGL